jgi:hypothetical protein
MFIKKKKLFTSGAAGVDIEICLDNKDSIKPLKKEDLRKKEERKKRLIDTIYSFLDKTDINLILNFSLVNQYSHLLINFDDKLWHELYINRFGSGNVISLKNEWRDTYYLTNYCKFFIIIIIIKNIIN